MSEIESDDLMVHLNMIFGETQVQNNNWIRLEKISIL